MVSALVQTHKPSPFLGGGGLKTQIENYTKELTNDELNTEKVVTGAAVLTAIGTAALLLYRGLSGKGVDSKTVQAAAQGIAGSTEKPAVQEAVHIMAESLTKPVEQKVAESIVVAEQKAAESIIAAEQKTVDSAKVVEQKVSEAINSIKDGTTTYSSARDRAKQNLTHDQKKLVQKQLNQFNSNSKRSTIIAEQHENELSQIVTGANSKLNTTQQNTGKVTKETLGNFKKSVDSQVDAARSAVQEKRDAANALIQQGKQPTRKQRINLQRAENELIEIEKKAERAKAKAAKSATNAMNQESMKVQSALEYMEHTTPEQRELQAVKNKVQHEKAVNRRFEREINKPKYQNKFRELARKENHTLEKALKTEKDPIIRQFIEDLLASRK